VYKKKSVFLALNSQLIYTRKSIKKYINVTHLGWPGGIGLGLGSLLLLEVSRSILPSTNLGGLL